MTDSKKGWTKLIKKLTKKYDASLASETLIKQIPIYLVLVSQRVVLFSPFVFICTDHHFSAE